MPLNSFTVGLTIGDDLPELSGPDDLSSAIIHLRKSLVELHDGDVGWLSPISDDGIRRLIKLAFYASLAAEEGRYPRFRLINRIDDGADTVGFAAAFDTPIIDVESLRRLAPTAAETDGALLIVERDGSLHCTGSLVVSDMGFGTRIGRPEIVGVGRSPSLIIRVDGPGSLRATDTAYTLLLNRGRIRQVVDYWLVRQVQGLWNELAAQIGESTASIHGAESRAYFGGPWALGALVPQSLVQSSCHCD